jgi:hypothetical protein
LSASSTLTLGIANLASLKRLLAYGMQQSGIASNMKT